MSKVVSYFVENNNRQMIQIKNTNELKKIAFINLEPILSIVNTIPLHIHPFYLYFCVDTIYLALNNFNLELFNEFTNMNLLNKDMIYNIEYKSIPLLKLNGFNMEKRRELEKMLYELSQYGIDIQFIDVKFIDIENVRYYLLEFKSNSLIKMKKELSMKFNIEMDFYCYINFAKCNLSIC